ncbi:hypothetical protein MSZK_21340 [Mycobacterium sp. shizuoka-1]|nr:hypothetical protein MSZK_21340 [Mycobacterium sp. shizuoka-1]
MIARTCGRPKGTEPLGTAPAEAGAVRCQSTLSRLVSWTAVADVVPEGNREPPGSGIGAATAMAVHNATGATTDEPNMDTPIEVESETSVTLVIRRLQPCWVETGR